MDPISGSLGSTSGCPRALVVLLAIVVGVVWIPLRRSTLGLSLYAIGSNQLAAFRSGVPVGRTKIVAYALTRAVRGAGRAGADREHRASAPPSRARTRCRASPPSCSAGSAWRAAAAASSARSSPCFILALVRTDLTFLGVNPNLSTAVQGAILIGVVMFGSLVAMRKVASVSAARLRLPPAPRNAAGLRAAAWRRLLRDQPLLPLVGLLLGAHRRPGARRSPGIVSADWVGVTLRAAIPLAILAACQTLTMLTGGIDLSVGVVASMAAFLMATLATARAPLVAIVDRARGAAFAGPRERHRRRACSGSTR